MAGLIPLMLASGNRTSFIGPSPTTTTTTSTSRRRQSSYVAPTSSSTPTTPTTPTFPTFRPKPQVKRLSLPTPAPAPIVVLPYTKAEWRKTIAEVKRKYFSKRYRACSARCLEVLEGIKDHSEVEPIYLIYLHFYAATSLEICARPLPSNGPQRAAMLLQARTHFNKASELINAAEESVLKKFRPGSVGSSRGSSCHSPSGSISSRAWTPDTRVSSPTESICSFDDFALKQSPPKRVKKVSFSLPRDEPIEIDPEPMIRPDSPTLGFEEYYLIQTSAPTTPQQEEPPRSFKTQDFPSRFYEIEMPLETIPEHIEPEDHHLECVPEEPEEEEQASQENDEENYAVASAVARACEHLATLRAQLARHSTSLDQLISSQQQQEQQQKQQQQQQQPQKPQSSQPRQRRHRISLLPVPSPTSPTTPIISVTQLPPSKFEEARAADRQARIERLRKTGWQRKRFDAKKYEELAETALAELVE
ncbi:hypothetical protein VTJ04DRAFT_1128 [Mycothermus thermophilus]|uniref:uncharacterized protein n=1 Tax=Humicola insolens TaxID=85995 RepID=UPI00374414B4